jgi:hypothetical protein
MPAWKPPRVVVPSMVTGLVELGDPPSPLHDAILAYLDSAQR